MHIIAVIPDIHLPLHLLISSQNTPKSTMGFLHKKEHHQNGPSSSDRGTDGAISDKEQSDGGNPGSANPSSRFHEQLHRDESGSGTEQNTSVNPGGFDPAETTPSRRNYTVSQVPIPPFTKLGNPGPLGLLSFALTTFALGLYQCGAGYVSSV